MTTSNTRSKSLRGGAGEIQEWTEEELERDVDTSREPTHNKTLCSTNAQLFRLLVGAFSVERAFKTLEVGFQSNVGLRTSNVTNFNSLITRRNAEGDDGVRTLDGSYQAYVDTEYVGGIQASDGDAYESDDGPNGDIYRTEIQAGTYSAADTRYSFFRIYHRDIGEENFVASEHLYSIRSATGVDVYNFLRFKFDDSKRREFRFMPISSWEVRNNIGTWDRLYAIDAHDSTERSVDENGYTIEFTGALIDNPEEEFAVKAFQPPEEREVEECTTREETVIDQEIDIVNPGQGYSAVGGVPIPDPDNAGGTLLVETYYPVTMVSTTGQGENFTALVGVRAPETDPTNGFVAIVLIDPYDSSDLMGYVDGTQVRFQSDAAVGGGFGFVGRVSIRDRVITECETVTLGNPQLGIAPPDDNVTGQESYVDGYARIAEAFIYDGVSTTASEPEHKISYINIITENETPPQYDEMALVGLNIRSSKELRSLDQLSVYVQEGVIDSHLFPDVFYDLLTQDRYGTGEFFDEQQIDIDSFNAAATWTEARRYFFDGAISDKINLRTWGAERARDFLLDLSISSGQFTLKPTINFDGQEPIAAMYSSGNIIEDTLRVNYFDTQERLDPVVTVRWREERRDTSLDSRGLFPQIREFSVRRRGVSENAPVIQVDLSSFCTNRKHAEDRAKLECQSKRYITHAVTFKTTPSETGVQAGSIIKLGIETVYFEQPQNGAISNTGEVTSWPPLDDGTYNALVWDGNTLAEKEITISNGKSSDINSVFSIERSTNKAETYKVSSVSFDEDGNVDIEALYWPTKDGVSLMTLDWEDTPDKESIWEIDG